MSEQLDLFGFNEPLIEPVKPVDTHVEESDVDRLTGQNGEVRDLLHACGMIKNSVAIEQYKILRLAARIRDLRAAGMRIKTVRRVDNDTIYVWEDYS